eukprot:COSAG01_NODE_35_length_34814_cov_128.883624_5_plen_121_part_00
MGAGHWGLAKASAADVLAPIPQRWAVACHGAAAAMPEGEAAEAAAAVAPATPRTGVAGARLAFSPVTEMTEEFMRDAARQMQAARNEADRGGLTESATTTSAEGADGGDDSSFTAVEASP